MANSVSETADSGMNPLVAVLALYGAHGFAVSASRPNTNVPPCTGSPSSSTWCSPGPGSRSSPSVVAVVVMGALGSVVAAAVTVGAVPASVAAVVVAVSSPATDVLAGLRRGIVVVVAGTRRHDERTADQRGQDGRSTRAAEHRSPFVA